MEIEPIPEEFSKLLVGSSLRNLWPQVRQAKDSLRPLFIKGRTGTGKTLLAKLIHVLSSRANKRFVRLNCGAIPETLLDSYLFGHRKGAFSGAIKDHIGKFELAQDGTLFLDEIECAIALVQEKLLGVLDEGFYSPVGESEELRSNARIILASNQDIPSLVASGRFREDLLYRISASVIELPSLKDRRGDIPELAVHFSRTKALEGRAPISMDDAGMKLLQKFSWPGNVRQLGNFIADLSEKYPGGALTACEIKCHLPKVPKREMTDRLITETLALTGGDLAASAKILEVDLSTLYRYRVKFQLR